MSLQNEIREGHSSADLDCVQFRSLATQLSNIIASTGIESKPFRSAELPLFSQLTKDLRRAAIKDLAMYVHLCQGVIDQGEDLRSSSKFTWRAVREAGLVPPSDLFAKISDPDIVEIYDLNNIQRFRNFRFFKYCSYTIEDLYCRPWRDLFLREDEHATLKMVGVLENLLHTRNRDVVPMGVGPQLIREVDSVRMRVNELTVKHIAVLYDRDDKAAAFVVIEDARSISNA